LRSGHAIVVTDAFLEWAFADYSDDIRSAYNARRCGVHDAYVAWIGNENAPADLRYGDGVAYASGKYFSELQCI